MNFMRYPLANWVLETTKTFSSEVLALMFAFPGAKRLVPVAIGKGVPPITSVSIEDRIRIGGISKQIVSGD
jgi:hypothetical protein